MGKSGEKSELSWWNKGGNHLEYFFGHDIMLEKE